jgi:hypothetical protein
LVKYQVHPKVAPNCTRMSHNYQLPRFYSNASLTMP